MEKCLSNQQIEDDTTHARARLPGLEIEIIHRRSSGADAEQISINPQAVPSFEAFVRFLETVNPFAFWAHCTNGLAPLARSNAHSDAALERRLSAAKTWIGSNGTRS